MDSNIYLLLACISLQILFMYLSIKKLIKRKETKMLIETKTKLGEQILINIDNIEIMYYADDSNIIKVNFVSGDDCIINESYESFLEKIKSEQSK